MSSDALSTAPHRHAAVVMTAMGEPTARIERRLAELVDQDAGVLSEVLVACPPGDDSVRSARRPRDARWELRFVDNVGGARSGGLNAAIWAASADVICRVDARSSIGPSHVGRCVGVLAGRPEVGIVGGAQRPVAGGPGSAAAGIARALANPYALGGAAYRHSGRDGPVDTVYLGAFRRHDVVALGGFDVRLAANEDFDLCARYRQAGFVVLLDSSLTSTYEARTTLAGVALQYHAFGRAKVRYWRTTGGRPNHRQGAALVLAGAGAAGMVWTLWRRPRLVGPVVAAAAVVGLAGDAMTGAPAEGARLAVRIAAVATYAGVWGGWLSGIATEALARRVWPTHGTH